MLHPERLADSELNSCSREQVQIIGRIQPHGMLFALSEPDLAVTHVSANVSDWLGMTPEALLGQSFERVLGAVQFATFNFDVRSDQPIISNDFTLPIRGAAVNLHCAAHRQDGVLIVEMEPINESSSVKNIDLDKDIRVPMGRMAHAKTLLALSSTVAHEIQRLSGFDRALIYRFDEDWNGEVIAEAGGSSPVNYLGLRFPANDIPPQVRQLFLINTIRNIADIDAASVVIIPTIGPLTGRALDLTRSVLRSASPVHLEYMRQMNVWASLTASIVVAGKLWGMIACHHDTPRLAAPTTRSLIDFLAQMFAAQVLTRLETEELHLGVESRRLIEQYLSNVDVAKTYVNTDSLQVERLLEIFDADGLAWKIRGVTGSHGFAGVQSRIPGIVASLVKSSTEGVASSRSLALTDDNALANMIGGALFIGLPGPEGDYLVFLRREMIETVTWAGNPNKLAPASGRIEPRSSFAAWQEVVRGRSRRWSRRQLDDAAFLHRRLERLERRHAFQTLTNQFNMATAAARIGVHERDLATGEVWWNRGMFEILGQDPLSFQPTWERWLEIIHVGDRDRVSATAGNAERARVEPTIRYRIVTSQGSVRHIETTASLVAQTAHTDGGRIAGIAVDVTQRVESEQREVVLQEQLRETSRRAGMAEIATGVLHDVGNVLNSLGIAATTAKRALKTMRLEQLEKASALLLQNRTTLAGFLTEDTRGRHLPEFLAALSSQVSGEVHSIRAEVDSIDSLLEHLRTVVSAQQTYAELGGEREAVNLQQLLELALLVQGAESLPIQIERQYESNVPPVITDRHKLMQIMVNLVSNARDALQDPDLQSRRITVSVSLEGEHAIVSVRDTGVGMSAEVLANLWRFGFTTKPGGHGFGLHNSANAARALGASLTAHSDGPRQGSQFILRLPVEFQDPPIGSRELA